MERVLASRGNDRKVSAGWWSSFVGRYPEIVLRIPVIISLARASASDCCIVNNYFDELELILEKNELLDKPCLIFNMDEMAWADPGGAQGARAPPISVRGGVSSSDLF